MKIAVTGASGFVGQALIRTLRRSTPSHQLLVVGRDLEKLHLLFPGVDACTYVDLVGKAQGFDVLVHLAAANNNVDEPPAYFEKVNVDLAADTAEKAKAACITRFIYVSSTHALNEKNSDAYSSSKKKASERLKTVEKLHVDVVYLASVHDEGFSGKLYALNRLPEKMARALFAILRAAKPTTSASLLTDYVLSPSRSSADTAVILTDGQRQGSVYNVIRRLCDLIGAIGIVVLLWWLLLALWFAVRLQSKGPGIFAQPRVGRNGVVFTCYKFRTMHLGTVQAATNHVSSSAVTSLGRVLRRTKLDELPQIWNIIRNEMSFVGPRPCLPSQVELVEARRVLGVLAVKPGITGLAQIRGIDMSDPQRLAKVDERYVALRSLALDLQIAIATVRGSGQGDNTAS